MTLCTKTLMPRSTRPTADYARIPNEYRLDTIRQYGGIKCAPGQKASRIINRLCLKFHLDQIEEEAEAGEPDNRYMRTIKPYNALFARLADALNPAHIRENRSAVNPPLRFPRNVQP